MDEKMEKLIDELWKRDRYIKFMEEVEKVVDEWYGDGIDGEEGYERIKKFMREVGDE